MATPTTATPSGSPSSANLPFDTVLRGYERRQVDEYVTKAKGELASLKEELAEAQRKRRQADEHAEAARSLRQAMEPHPRVTCAPRVVTPRPRGPRTPCRRPVCAPARFPADVPPRNPPENLRTRCAAEDR